MGSATSLYTPSVNRLSRDDLPTVESPRRIILNWYCHRISIAWRAGVERSGRRFPGTTKRTDAMRRSRRGRPAPVGSQKRALSARACASARVSERVYVRARCCDHVALDALHRLMIGAFNGRRRTHAHFLLLRSRSRTLEANRKA